MTRDDALKFHQTWWRPDNAILVITGDVTPEAGFQLAEEALGAWKKPETPLPAVQAASAAAASSTPLLVNIPKIGQAAVLMGRVGPSRNAPDYFPTLVVNDVLGGGYSARLNSEIRIKRGLSYGASSGLAARKQGAPIIAAAQTRNDAVPQVVDLMSGELTRLGTAPVSPAEIESRKAVLIGNFGRSVETTGGLAGQLSALAQFGLPLDKLQTFAADIQAVTPEQMAAAARAHFDPARASLVVVGDGAVFGSKLKARFPKLEQIPIDQLNLDSATLR
jgi:zinc protease